MMSSTKLRGLWAALAVGAVAAFAAGGAGKESRTAAPMRGGTVTGTAGRIQYIDEGPRASEAVPVVFVHSFAGSHSQWAAQWSHLRHARRVVALDLRGHGRSDAPAQLGGYSVDALASDIGAVAEALDLQPFVLVGHSMGAAASVAYAARNSQRVAGLVLVGARDRILTEQSAPVIASIGENYDALMEKYWTSLLFGARPETEAALRHNVWRLPRETALALIGAIFSYDPLPALAAYPGKKLIIDTAHGDGPNALHRQAPAVPRRMIVGTSHWPHMDKPVEFNRLLDEFL